MDGKKKHSIAIRVRFLHLSCLIAKGQSHVIGSPQPIVALAGDDVVLPCRLEPAVSDFSGTVEWTKEGLSPPFVHVHKSGGQVVQSQNPLYKYRTVLFVDELKNGNVSLKLFRATVSDEGTYLCFIPSIRKGDFIQLTVGDISGVTLECESKGWYPKPELLWLDAEGELLSAGAPETVRGPDGLYTVSSRVTVERNRSDTFTCRVQQLSINQSRDAHINVPGEKNEQWCSPLMIIILTSPLKIFDLQHHKSHSDRALQSCRS
uniref:Ig-like domain-containing protein n=1 Tax=Myripristis murdjan TaxID=586833 RepID=A0A667WMV9_9TELE